ncbi:hypothetical protein OIU85_001421 [Salix viminalis]|uniref:Uncharacterized protein n=1 Tax=Salix viminalis TaxID=40686 RepID=A0A9Q0ZY58_SALVM|nr:hypothetical protein OIU85_001421 [Salix viminalis]
MTVTCQFIEVHAGVTCRQMASPADKRRHLPTNGRDALALRSVQHVLSPKIWQNGDEFDPKDQEAYPCETQKDKTVLQTITGMKMRKVAKRRDANSSSLKDSMKSIITYAPLSPPACTKYPKPRMNCLRNTTHGIFPPELKWLMPPALPAEEKTPVRYSDR